jgi:hypothetical protein
VGLPPALRFLDLALLLVVQDAEVAAPTDHFLRRHGCAERSQSHAEFFGDAELEQQPVVLGELSL